MSRTCLLVPAALLGAATLFAVPAAEAQIGSTMRGNVNTVDGLPLPDVKVEFVFKGESRVPIVKQAKTDKKGQYVRVGLQSGEWKVTFTKEGFQDHSVNTWLSGDALSEVPPDRPRPRRRRRRRPPPRRPRPRCCASSGRRRRSSARRTPRRSKPCGPRTPSRPRSS